MGAVSMIAGTSTQRTYRYLRVSILGAVLALAVASAAVWAREGSLPSISALYYSSGAAVFVGVLFALSMAFLALSGRSLAQALLDVAAVFAPLVAIIPTPLADPADPGLCATGRPCVPAEFWPTIDTGMTVFAAVGAAALVAAVVIALAQRTLTRGTLVTILSAALVVAGNVAWWLLAPESFRAAGHLVVTVCFFALIAAVSAATAAASSGMYRWLYGTISAAIVLDLLVLVGIVVFGVEAAGAAVPPVFLAEAIAVALFAVFWIVQTVQTWPDVDPRAIV